MLTMGAGGNSDTATWSLTRERRSLQLSPPATFGNARIPKSEFTQIPHDLTTSAAVAALIRRIP